MLPDKDRHDRIRRSLALALNHEWPQLERTRKRVGELPAIRIDDEHTIADMPIVATVATDGGEGRLSLAPISIQIVRVADNRGVVHFEEFVPQSLRPDEVMRYFFASDERFQRTNVKLGMGGECMITKVRLLYEPGRKQPWLVKWWSDPDPDSGKQRRRTKAFQYKRDAAAFQAQKQAELDTGERRESSTDVTLRQLCEEFFKSRTVGLSYDSQACYRDMTAQLRGQFGASQPLRQIERRHAEAFIATQKRRDGRYGPLSSTTIAQRVTYARAIFAAAVDWGYITRNPFTAPRRGTSPLRAKRRSRPWQHIEPDEFLRFLAVSKPTTAATRARSGQFPSPKRRSPTWPRPSRDRSNRLDSLCSPRSGLPTSSGSGESARRARLGAGERSIDPG